MQLESHPLRQFAEKPAKSGFFVGGEKSLGAQIGTHEAPMKLKHYLSLASSGTWHFRKRVLADLIRVFGCRFLKRSLRTRDPLVAQRLALGMADAYAQAFRLAKGMHVSGDGIPSVATAITSVEDSEKYTLVIDGTLTLKAEPGPDHADTMDAVAKIGPMLSEPYIQKIMREARTAVTVPSPPCQEHSDLPDWQSRGAMVGGHHAEYLAEDPHNQSRCGGGFCKTLR